MNIRKLEEKDAIGMLDWMYDSEISYWFLLDFTNKTLDDCKSYIKSSCSETNKSYAIVNDNDEYMGTVSLKNIDKYNKNAEYAIVVRRCGLGKEYAKDATKSILQIAFDELRLHKVYLNVLEENTRAIRFYEKFGFEYEGMARDHILHKGKLKNLKWYSIFEGDFVK